jgi:hypothetical protein
VIPAKLLTVLASAICVRRPFPNSPGFELGGSLKTTKKAL